MSPSLRLTIYSVVAPMILLTVYRARHRMIDFPQYERWDSSNETNGIPPIHIQSCTLVLGSKSVGTGHMVTNQFSALTGTLHLFLNFYKNQTYYGIVESSYVGRNYATGGRSWARMRSQAWDHGGWQWKIPTSRCEEAISCLETRTREYHQANAPYHFLLGPNSNSFIWWVANQCSIQLEPKFSKYPFVGIDHYWTQQLK